MLLKLTDSDGSSLEILPSIAPSRIGYSIISGRGSPGLGIVGIFSTSSYVNLNGMGR